MDVTLLGMITDVKPLQLENALAPIDVTLLGMITDVRPLQPPKASVPMDVTPLPMLTDVKPLQLWYLQLVVYQLIYNKTVEK